MKTSHRLVSAAAAGTLGAAMFVAAPGVASAADPCMLGWSNVGPRTCAMTDVGMAPVWTLGNGLCAGMLTASGNAFDGPLWEYSSAPGAVHSVELRIAQGFSPLGEWASTTLACDVTAIVDWQNFDTGRSGTVSRYVPASNNSTSPAFVHVDTGPGRVRLTMRTDHPSIPVSTDIVVP
ncbi:hypothetical protein [Prescottella equi]|uniref:hypothetical protein n=1 Tax=Rhodococcus hoagii TaxID=43767 RepID=UPI001F35524B|nr:hypothetical protein [Prescottella equi]